MAIFSGVKLIVSPGLSDLGARLLFSVREKSFRRVAELMLTASRMNNSMPHTRMYIILKLLNFSKFISLRVYTLKLNYSYSIEKISKELSCCNQ